MKLTPDEYRRGLLSWDSAETLKFRTSSAPTREAPPDFSAPLADSGGSVVQSLDYQFRAIREEPVGSTVGPFQVRWEALRGDRIETRLWNDTLKPPPSFLLHIPKNGIFHRLVIKPTFLGWAEDAILRVGDIVIRLMDGQFSGDIATPFDQVELTESGMAISGGGVEPIELQGRFIEIIAPRESQMEAEARAFSILGLIALCLDDHAVGEPVLSEAYEASGARQKGSVRIPSLAQFPRQAQKVEIDMVHECLPQLIGDGKSTRGLNLALQMYEKCIRSDVPVDKLLAAVTGIEALVDSYASQYGPIPEEVERRESFTGLLEWIQQEFNSETYGRLTERIISTTITKRVRFYVQQHSVDGAVVEEFREVNNLRNRATHGDLVVIEFDQASQAKGVLAQLLQSALELPNPMPREPVPKVFSFSLEYELLINRPGPSDK